MITLDHFSFEHDGVQHEVLPRNHPLVRGQPINTPLYEQDFQWRLKIQPFSKGGFEARACLVNRNQLSRLINANRERGKRLKPKDREEHKIALDREKAGNRAARKVRQLCIEIHVDRLLTLTSRNLLTDYDQMVATWKRFLRLMEQAGSPFEYIAVPELHDNGQHYHIHAAINGYVKADILRRCWQIALGGKGNERGSEALGNIDIKRRKRPHPNPIQQAVSIAKYIAKYISKSYEQHHEFNRKRYWAPRSIKLPECHGEWMQAQTLAEALSELYPRLGHTVMMEAFNNSLYVSESSIPMIFLRYVPRVEPVDGDTPF
jgi:hypothetical protein